MSPESASLPTSKSELLSSLRTLAKRHPQTKEEMRSLQQESLTLALHIQRRMSIHDVPEAVWHFLSDPDIRFKDAAYADSQLAGLREELAKWESNGDI